jgi:hypothetical protein
VRPPCTSQNRSAGPSRQVLASEALSDGAKSPVRTLVHFFIELVLRKDGERQKWGSEGVCIRRGGYRRCSSALRGFERAQGLISPAWFQLSDQVPSRNGPTTSFWKTTRYCGSVVCAGRRSSSPSMARRRSFSLNRNGRSDVNSGSGRGFAALPVIGVAARCTRRMGLPSYADFAAGTITVRGIATAAFRRQIG